VVVAVSSDQSPKIWPGFLSEPSPVALDALEELTMEVASQSSVPYGRLRGAGLAVVGTLIGRAGLRVIVKPAMKFGALELDLVAARKEQEGSREAEYNANEASSCGLLMKWLILLCVG